MHGQNHWDKTKQRTWKTDLSQNPRKMKYVSKTMASLQIKILGLTACQSELKRNALQKPLTLISYQIAFETIKKHLNSLSHKYRGLDKYN